MGRKGEGAARSGAGACRAALSAALAVAALALRAVVPPAGGAGRAFALAHAAPSVGGRGAARNVCVVGAGPCGLFLASRLLGSDPAVRVTVLERAPREGARDDRAFGFGVGGRMRRILSGAGLMDDVDGVCAPCPMGPGRRLGIVRRLDLCRVLRSRLEETYGGPSASGGGRRFECVYGADVDGDELTVLSREYDLVVGADGINSSVRRLLVERGAVREEHYLLERVRWKALRLPPQRDIKAGAFQPLSHPDGLLRGAVLPRHPEGHTLLIFWRDDDFNPGGIQTPEELKAAIKAAVEGKSAKLSVVQRLNWSKNVNVDEEGKEVDLTFDEEEVDRFLKCRPGREQYMKVDKYHHVGEGSAFALVGDAAHGMYSGLAQGCACAFQGSVMLADCLAEGGSLESALEAYSTRAVPEGHAASDLNLLSHVTGISETRLPSLSKALGTAQLVLGGLLGRKMPVERVNDDVPYGQVLKEYWLAVAMARRLWKQQREPVGMDTNKDSV